jgi:hypothetical protein
MRRPTPRGLVLALTLGLGGGSCEAPDRLGLPTLVNVIARLEDGSYASLLVSLDAPRAHPSLRVSQGLVSYDGHQLLEILPRDPIPGGPGELGVADLLRNAAFTVRIEPTVDATRLEVVHLRERSALLRAVDGEGATSWWEVGLFTGEVQPLAEAHATRRFERYGPQRGFAVYMAEDHVMLGLPREDSGEDMVLLDGVDGVVSVNWIAEEYFPSSGLDVLDRRFKMAGSVVAMARNAEPDGDLREWSQDQALSVGTASHVAGGLVAWSGSRDASFALAARLAPQALCAAVRVRDDHILPGEDSLTVVTDLRRYELPVPAQPGPVDQPGMRAAFTDQASFGFGLELCLEPEVWTAQDGHVAFRVIFRDKDPDLEPTYLASAPDIPWPALAGVRLPRRGREGTLPPR